MFRRPLLILAAAACVAAVAAGGLPAGASTVTPENLAPGQCRSAVIPVALAAGQPADQRIAALYCTPARRPSRIDVLVPGFTYTGMYFNWRQDPAVYNFTWKDLAAGRAVLDIDRLGSGQSSHPLSTDITATVQAYALHEVIGWVRAVLGYGTVDVIGHSLGSIDAVIDAGTWPSDPSALVLTGLASAVTANATENLSTALEPAASDPVFARIRPPLDPGYVTTVPGVRGQLFYYDGDPAVIAYDEAHKNFGSVTELQTGVASTVVPPGSNVAGKVTAPTMILVGQEDYLYCLSAGAAPCDSWGALTAFERPYFADAASLTAESVPDSGHDVGLNQPIASFVLINSWLSRH